MEELAYFVEENRIDPEIGHGQLTLRGDLHCSGGLVLHVHKVLEINEHDQVLAVDYSYHAYVPTLENRPVFRYDNSHIHAELGHPDAFHKHLYSAITGREVAIHWIGRDYWPFMNEVIEELYEWWLQHTELLEGA